VVGAGAPNIDEVVVFKEFPKMDDEVVVLETPKIDDVEVPFVGVPNKDEVVVAFVGVPKTEGVLLVVVILELPNIVEALIVFVEVLKIEGGLVVFVGVLKIDVALFVFVGVLKIEAEPFEFVGILKIDEALVTFVEVLKIDVWHVVLIELPKMLVVLVLFGVPNIEVLVDGISKIGALLVVTRVVGTFSLSGVTGSDIIGVGLSETWGVVSITLLLVVVAGTVLKTDVVLTTPKVVDDTVEPLGSVFTAGSEKLKDAVTVVVAVVEVQINLVSAADIFEMSFLGAVKLNVENNVVSGFELKLKAAVIESFTGTVSCLFFNLSSVLSPENTTGVSKGLDNAFDGSKLTVLNDGVSILFLIESAKLNIIDMLVFGIVVSVFTVDTLVKSKGIFSFDSVVPEITSTVDFVETTLKVLLKFKGVEVDDFKLKSMGGSLLETPPLFPTNVVLAELKTIGSLVKTL